MTALFTNMWHKTRASAVFACVWFYVTHPYASIIMCGYSGVNLQKSQNPDELGAFRVAMFFVGDRPCQLFFSSNEGGGGGRLYNAAQKHKTGTYQDRYYTALPAHIPLLDGIGRRTDHGDDGGPPGGGGSDGLTAAMPCWLLLLLGS